jgi:hypothetical protein
MNLSKAIVTTIAAALCLLTAHSMGVAQSTQMYQQMNASQRGNFVSAKAKEIGRRIADKDYTFTASFETKIQASLESYLQRLTDVGRTSPLVIIERGKSEAPTITSAFKQRGVSPLIGLYLPWIESEYVNLPNAKPSGSIGIFQFLPQTGMRFGLNPEDLLDVAKAADAAALYIASSSKRFDKQNMKELLAVLAFNRGENNVERDIAQFVDGTNKDCSVCALSEPNEADKAANMETVYYVPRFFAAAILGENPQAFGLPSPPLSSFGTRH